MVNAEESSPWERTSHAKSWYLLREAEPLHAEAVPTLQKGRWLRNSCNEGHEKREDGATRALTLWWAD